MKRRPPLTTLYTTNADDSLIIELSSVFRAIAGLRDGLLSLPSLSLFSSIG